MSHKNKSLVYKTIDDMYLYEFNMSCLKLVMSSLDAHSKTNLLLYNQEYRKKMELYFNQGVHISIEELLRLKSINKQIENYILSKTIRML